MDYRIGLVPRAVWSVKKGDTKFYRHAANTEFTRERIEAQKAAQKAEQQAAQETQQEAAQRAAAQQSHLHGEGSARGLRSEPRGNLIAGTPSEQTKLRLSIMRKLVLFSEPHRTCARRTCRRHRACASPAHECANMSADKPISEKREQTALTNLQRALARRLAEVKIAETNRVEK